MVNKKEQPQQERVETEVTDQRREEFGESQKRIVEDISSIELTAVYTGDLPIDTLSHVSEEEKIAYRESLDTLAEELAAEQAEAMRELEAMVAAKKLDLELSKQRKIENAKAFHVDAAAQSIIKEFAEPVRKGSNRKKFSIEGVEQAIIARRDFDALGYEPAYFDKLDDVLRLSLSIEKNQPIEEIEAYNTRLLASLEQLGYSDLRTSLLTKRIDSLVSIQEVDGTDQEQSAYYTERVRQAELLLDSLKTFEEQVNRFKHLGREEYQTSVPEQLQQDYDNLSETERWQIGRNEGVGRFWYQSRFQNSSSKIISMYEKRHEKNKEQLETINQRIAGRKAVDLFRELKDERISEFERREEVSIVQKLDIGGEVYSQFASSANNESLDKILDQMRLSLRAAFWPRNIKKIEDISKLVQQVDLVISKKGAGLLGIEGVKQLNEYRSSIQATQERLIARLQDPSNRFSSEDFELLDKVNPLNEKFTTMGFAQEEALRSMVASEDFKEVAGIVASVKFREAQDLSKIPFADKFLSEHVGVDSVDQLVANKRNLGSFESVTDETSLEVAISSNERWQEENEKLAKQLEKGKSSWVAANLGKSVEYLKESLALEKGGADKSIPNPHLENPGRILLNDHDEIVDMVFQHGTKLEYAAFSTLSKSIYQLYGMVEDWNDAVEFSKFEKSILPTVQELFTSFDRIAKQAVADAGALPEDERGEKQMIIEEYNDIVEGYLVDGREMMDAIMAG